MHIIININVNLFSSSVDSHHEQGFDDGESVDDWDLASIQSIAASTPLLPQRHHRQQVAARQLGVQNLASQAAQFNC